jgi:lactoylglutathione lyase
MQFCWATLMVNDMEESLKFYQNIVGLSISRRFSPTPGREIVFLGDGETKVELICDRDGEKGEIGKGVCLGFVVSSVDEKMNFVREKGVAIHSGPFSPTPRTRFFYVQDPNGLKVQFVENLI